MVTRTTNKVEVEYTEYFSTVLRLKRHLWHSGRLIQSFFLDLVERVTQVFTVQYFIVLCLIPHYCWVKLS
jgi:hypothetical protein